MEYDHTVPTPENPVERPDDLRALVLDPGRFYSQINLLQENDEQRPNSQREIICVQSCAPRARTLWPNANSNQVASSLSTFIITIDNHTSHPAARLFYSSR